MATLIRDLRAKTNAGLADCKKALEATSGDMDQAIEWLRKKGIASASKLTSRVSSDGLIVVSQKNGEAVMLEINSETDFVARNEKFQSFVRNLSSVAHTIPSPPTPLCANSLHLAVPIDLILEQKVVDPITTTSTLIPVHDALKSVASNFGENIRISRAIRVQGRTPSSVVGSYVHNHVAENMGTMGAIIALQSSIPSLSPEQAAAVHDLANQLALHIVGAGTRYLAIENCSGADVESEKAVHIELAKKSGKPDDVIAKIVAGRMKGFFDETVLLEQKSLTVEGNPKISQVLANTAKKFQLGTLDVVSFGRFKLGETSKAPATE